MVDSPAFRMPADAPTSADIADSSDWKKLVDKSVDDIRVSAGKWRDGLAATVAVLTGGLVISGPSTMKELPAAFRWLVGAGLGLGYAATCVGLLLALHAAAGVPKLTEYSDIAQSELTVQLARTAQAGKDAKFLRYARRFVYAAIVLVWIGLMLWWAAPAPSKQPPAFVKLDTQAGVVCGKLTSGDHQVLVVQVDGERDLRRVQLPDVRNLRVVAGC